MTYIALIFAIAWAFQTWRKRVWKKRWHLIANIHTQAMVGEFAKIWADGFRDSQRTEDWPEEIESKWDA